MNKEKTVIIIVGPTASGKTEFSLQLAAELKTSIISADSRQCYKELNIGVAKPPEKALHSIKHYFINSHSIHDKVNAQVFENYALKAVDEIFEHSNTAVMVGGTGMYIKAFCEGLDEMPVIDAAVRGEIINAYNKKGLSWLQEEVQKNDPVFWEQAEQQNPQRLIRALEVFYTTGISISCFRTSKIVQRPFRIIKTGIDLTKQQLHERIENRVNEMVEQGLVDEVRSLLPFKHLNALQTVGYKEIFSYIDGETGLPESIKEIKSNTRKYAKRQLTWFRKDKKISWGADFQMLKSLPGL
jgi:tRNA dimethylallyltransferase